jgi:hypothetical protein
MLPTGIKFILLIEHDTVKQANSQFCFGSVVASFIAWNLSSKEKRLSNSVVPVVYGKQNIAFCLLDISTRLTNGVLLACVLVAVTFGKVQSSNVDTQSVSERGEAMMKGGMGRKGGSLPPLPYLSSSPVGCLSSISGDHWAYR